MTVALSLVTSARGRGRDTATHSSAIDARKTAAASRSAATAAL
jgi:hypothetical protein